MHHTVAPTKRHHSQISMPTFSSNNANNTNHGNHPFENFMNVFGSTFHRPSRQQRQLAQQQSQTQQQQQQTLPSKPSSGQALQPTHHTKQPRQNTPSSNDDSMQQPTIYNGTTAKPTLRQPVIQSSRPSSPNLATAASSWRTALCPRSQKPYYWNVHTRESRWKKPLELASEEEKEAIRSKERKLKEFFESMERNILKKLEGGRRAADVGEGDASPGNAYGGNSGVANGIDQNWMQTTSTASTNNDKISQDWISGWITPGSDSNSQRSSSPSGSITSMEGLSILDLNSGSFSPGDCSTSFTSLGSLSREERDDKVCALQKPSMSKLERIKSSSSRPVIDKPNLIRTISKMEYDLIHQLNPSLGLSVQATTPRTFQAQTKQDEGPRTPTTQTCDIFSSLHLTLESEGLNVSLSGRTASTAIPMTPTSPLTPMSLDDSDLPLQGGPREDIVKPNLTKRNTCGTIYLGSTLSAPDKDALIKCVCGVYRAHLFHTESTMHASNNIHDNHYDTEMNQMFLDRRSPGDYRHLDTSSIPSLSQITDFYRSIFLRSQMEVDCIIISLIYIERLIKMTCGSLTPRANNWRSILFSCMVLASKVWDDLSMWNCDFSKIGPLGVTFSLSRTNELEVALLRALEYKVKVGASEYAKYYFLLRGMLCRSGLANDDLTRLRPLDVKGAQTLETTTCEKSNAVAKASMKERSKSYGDVGTMVGKSGEAAGRTGSEDSSVGGGVMQPPSSPSSKRVSLEQIVRM